jgi:hypothetical protein
MKPGEHRRPLSTSEAVRHAISIADPDDRDADLGRLEEAFEDADAPIRGEERLDERLAMALDGIDHDVEKPAVSIATAMILYLWRHPAEVDVPPHKLLQVAARAEWKGSPPAPVADWLADRDVAV